VVNLPDIALRIAKWQSPPDAALQRDNLPGREPYAESVKLCHLMCENLWSLNATCSASRSEALKISLLNEIRTCSPLAIFVTADAVEFLLIVSRPFSIGQVHHDLHIKGD